MRQRLGQTRAIRNLIWLVLTILIVSTMSVCSRPSPGEPPVPRMLAKHQLFEIAGRIDLIGTPEAPLNHVSNFSVSLDRILITNTRLNRIQLYDMNGELLLVLGGNRKGSTTFNRPTGGFIDTDGGLFINDTENNRVQLINQTGDYIESIASHGFTSHLFLITHGETASLVTVGQYVHDNMVYVVRRYSLGDGVAGYMLERPEPKLILNSSACLGEKENIYVCNMLLSKVYRINTKAESIVSFEFDSPSMTDFFKQSWAPADSRTPSWQNRKNGV